MSTVLLIVAFIGQEAQCRVLKFVKGPVFEVEAGTYEVKSLKSLLAKFRQDPSTVCNDIYGYNVCATATKITGGFSVDITADGEDAVSIDVTTEYPDPQCIEIEDVQVCAEVYNVDLKNLKGCAKVSAEGEEAEIGCFQASS